MNKAVKHFDNTSLSYLDEYYRQTPEGYSFRVRREKVLAEIPQVKNGERALDVGCGPGIMAEILLNKGYRFTGIDAAPKMIELAKKHYGGNPLVSFSVGDVYSLPYENSSFSIVIAMGLLEYLDDQSRAITELTRVMRSDGKIIITFPNWWSPWRIFNRLSLKLFGWLLQILKKKRHNITHREYTLNKVKRLLEEKGLFVTATHYYNFKLFPYPLEKLLPAFIVWQSKITESLDKTFLKWLGTGFIVIAEKKDFQ